MLVQHAADSLAFFACLFTNHGAGRFKDSDINGSDFALDDLFCCHVSIITYFWLACKGVYNLLAI